MIFLLLVAAASAQYSPQYNETEARMLLILSSGAYADTNQTAMNLCLNSALPSDAATILQTTMQNCDLFNNPCECYVAVSPMLNRIFAVFRGTKTDTQLALEGLSTLDQGEDFYGMGQVNKYFKHGHDLLWPSVKNTITDPRYAGYGVTFTGHSLGGALAALTAARVANEGVSNPSLIRMITFGEPRTGTAEFAQNFDRLISYSFRVVFRHDIVPHSPGCKKDKSVNALPNGSRQCDPSAMDKPYHHGTEVWYPSSMLPGSQYQICTGQPKNEDIQCSDQLTFSLGQNKAYVWDHRHYFAIEVPNFGHSGCNPAYPEGYNDLSPQPYGYRK